MREIYCKYDFPMTNGLFEGKYLIMQSVFATFSDIHALFAIDYATSLDSSSSVDSPTVLYLRSMPLPPLASLTPPCWPQTPLAQLCVGMSQ